MSPMLTDVQTRTLAHQFLEGFSMRVRRPSIPTPKPPVVDRLAFLLRWATSPNDDQQVMLERVRRRVQKEIDDGSCEHAFVKLNHYRLNFRIRLDGGTQPLVQIGARIPERQKGGIRVDMNPAKFAPGDMKQFHEVMGRIVGPSYPRLLRRPLLHRVDFAVDVVHADLSRMLVSYTNAHRFTMFGKRVSTKGNVEGYNFGSVTSSYMTAVYAKDIEQMHRAVVDIAKKGLRRESLKANVIKQAEQLCGAPPKVRVEVRSMKMNNMSPHKLASQPNRFKRFAFAYLPDSGGALPAWLETAFLSLCRDKGVKAALNTFKGSEHARKVNAFWKSRQCTWWNPGPMWAQACAALRQLGVFPAAAFKPEEARPEKVLNLDDVAPRFAKPVKRPGQHVTFKRTYPGIVQRSTPRTIALTPRTGSAREQVAAVTRNRRT
ncbi:hypothetical protein [Burkholderia sp. 9120]|uniref:hypothetical protein n=1 Tax=Burkholderia sp. 9120 TaxID=1500897 RepID=UPI0012E0B9C7|nr:hypothetical protein [Burkholderia sp. 9120]